MNQAVVSLFSGVSEGRGLVDHLIMSAAGELASADAKPTRVAFLLSVIPRRIILHEAVSEGILPDLNRFFICLVFAPPSMVLLEQ